MTATPPTDQSPPAPDSRPLSRPVRWLLKGLAGASLLLGIIGIFLPVMPTVPFILLAAWAAARSSPRLSHWLENHPRLGPHIQDWRRGGVVRRPAKWMATVMMAGGATTMMFIVRPIWVPLAVTALMAGVGVWLWHRPEHPPG
jgi:uncharacterized membrane protein YbaN (DUF454 family)